MIRYKIGWKSGHIAIGKITGAGYPEDPPLPFLEVKSHIADIINASPEDDLESGLRVV